MKHFDNPERGISLMEEHLSLIRLHYLRDKFREGWTPDWSDKSQEKWCILRFPDFIQVCEHDIPRFLSFQTEEIAEKFLEENKELIEKSKELL